MTTAYGHGGTVPQWDISDRLRKARTHAGLDQGELALRMGVTRSTVSNAENGKASPQRSTLTLWAMACGVPFDWLTTGKDPDDDPDPNSGLRIISGNFCRHFPQRTVSNSGHRNAG